MSNLEDIKAKGTEVILSGNKEYLKYDLNAFAELEERYGSINKAIDGLQGKIEKDEDGKPLPTFDENGKVAKDKDGQDIPRRSFSIKLLRTLLWTGLIYAKPDLTEQEVGALVDFSDLKNIIEAIGKAIQNSMPKLTKEEENQVKAEAKFKEEQLKEKQESDPNFTKEAKNQKTLPPTISTGAT